MTFQRKDPKEFDDMTREELVRYLREYREWRGPAKGPHDWELALPDLDPESGGTIVMFVDNPPVAPEEE